LALKNIDEIADMAPQTTDRALANFPKDGLETGDTAAIS
jgi:hypothetical protein